MFFTAGLFRIFNKLMGTVNLYDMILGQRISRFIELQTLFLESTNSHFL